MTEKLNNVVNQILTQVEEVKSGTYNLVEVQRVRESAGTVKNSMRNMIESIHSDPRFVSIVCKTARMCSIRFTLFRICHIFSFCMQASYAKILPFLNELVSKLDETEKVLAELEKSNQNKRKVILVNKDATSSAEAPVQFAATSAATALRPNMTNRSWNKTLVSHPGIRILVWFSFKFSWNNFAFHFSPVSLK